MSVRGISKTFNRFISIMGIVALGVGFLAGLIAATPDMKETTDSYINDLNLYEINIKGTLGLTDADVERVNAVEGIDRVMPAYVNDFIMISDKDLSQVVRLYGVLEDDGTSALNSLVLKSGRLPQNEGECVVEIPSSYNSVEYSSLKISSETPDYNKISETLSITEFTVVGIVKSAQYISIETEYSTVGNGSVSLVAYTFKSAYAMDVYTDIFCSTSLTGGMNTFDDVYENKLSEVKETLKPIGEQQSTARYDQVVSEAQKKLDESKAELLDSKRSVYAKLSNAYRAIVNGKDEIAKYEAQLAESRTELDKNADLLINLKEQLTALGENIDKYTALEAQLKPTADAIKALQQQGIELTEQQLQLLSQYNSIISFLSAAPGNKITLETNIAALAAGIEAGNSKYAEAVASIDEQKNKLNAAEYDYADAKATADNEFADADKKIEDAEKEISTIDVPSWYIFDRTQNSGVNSYKSNAMKVAAIAKVFPVFFFLVAALVALTTMSRLVDEQRTQIGTLKSLGFSNYRILRFYLLYSGLASAIGTIIGLLVGFKIFPAVISNTYKMMFNTPVASYVFRWEIAVPVGLITILSILFTTYSACEATLREQPAGLMITKAPSAGKRILLERIKFIWNHMKFMSKVTARNLFRYKKRFLMTIIGVAGCSALLVTGFGVRDSVNSIVSKQFEDIEKYNLTVKIDETKDIFSDSDLTAFLESASVSKYLPIHSETVDIVTKSDDYSLSMQVAQDSEDYNDFISFKSRTSGKAVEFDDNSVVITEKLAEVAGIKVGDHIEVRRSNNRINILTVTGITENYVLSYLYVGRDAYKTAFHSDVVFNQILIKTDASAGLSTDEIGKLALSCPSVSYCVFSDSIMSSFANSVKSIDYIVIVIILCAGMLSMIVIYNLTNVNICERKKELATLKVLGFHNRETCNYIFKETNVLSLIGTAVGLVGGIWLHRFVVLTVEVDSVMFGRSIKPLSFVLSAIISIGFTLIVDLIMKRNVSSIDMVEAMKAND